MLTPTYLRCHHLHNCDVNSCIIAMSTPTWCQQQHSYYVNKLSRCMSTLLLFQHNVLSTHAYHKVKQLLALASESGSSIWHESLTLQKQQLISASYNSNFPPVWHGFSGTDSSFPRDKICTLCTLERREERHDHLNRRYKLHYIFNIFDQTLFDAGDIFPNTLNYSPALMSQNHWEKTFGIWIFGSI